MGVAFAWWEQLQPPRSSQFVFSVFIDPQTRTIAKVGETIPLSVDRSTVPDQPGLITVWPVRAGRDEEATWQNHLHRFASWLRMVLRESERTTQKMTDGQSSIWVRRKFGASIPESWWLQGAERMVR